MTYICARTRKMSFVVMCFSKATRSSRHRTWKGAQPDCITYQTDMGEITSIQDATSPHYSQTTSCIYVEAVRSHWYATKATACYTTKVIPYSRTTRPISPNSQPTEFEHDGKTYKRYLPDKVLDFFNDEFDYRELANWQDLQNLAMAYFTLIASPYEVTSGGGGGGLQSDLKWGRDQKRMRLSCRRCAMAASNRIGRHPKGGMKRK